MMRKMAVIGLSYLLGLFCAPFFHNDILLILGIGTALFAVIFFYLTKGSRRQWLAAAGAVIAAAFIVHFSYEKAVYRPIASYDGVKTEITGTVLECKDLSSDMSLYIIRTSLSGHTAKIGLYAPSESVTPYDEVTVNARLYIPQDNALFPQKYYYKSQGIFLFANSGGQLRFTTPNSKPIQYYLLSYAEYIKEEIRELLPKESGGLLIATLFGDKSGLSEQTKLNLTRSGIGHITSVSGMHLAIIAGVISSLFKRTKMSRKVSAATLLTLVAAFVIFTGMNVTAIRSAIMIAVYNLAGLLRRKGDPLSALGIAALILALPAPYAARDIGLLLSMLGVIGVGPVGGAIYAAIKRKWKLSGLAGAICSAGVMSFGGSICTFPIVMLAFDEVSLIAPITNVLIIPASTIALVCAVMFALLGGVQLIGIPLCFAAGLCMRFVLWISDLMAGVKLAYVSLESGYIVIWVLLTAAALLVAFITLKSWAFSGYIGLAAVGVLLCSSLAVRVLDCGSLRISVMSDGTRGAVVCIEDSTAWVIKLGNGYDKLAKQITDYLNLYGVERIELLAMPVMRQSEVAVYTEGFESFNIETAIIPQQILDSNPNLFEDCKIYIADDMVISLGNGYNISMNWIGENYDLALYSDEFTLQCIDANRYITGLSAIRSDLLVLMGKTKDEIILDSVPYSVVLNHKQVAYSSLGASIIHPYTESRVEFLIRGDEIIKRRWGVGALY